MVASENGTHPFNLMLFGTLQADECYIFYCQTVSAM